MDPRRRASTLCIDLSGRTALVTGGTRGIGRAISLTLARAGASVAAVYRSDQSGADSLKQELTTADCPHLVLRADITDQHEVNDVMEQVSDQFDGLDILVHNASVVTHAAVDGMPDEVWDKVLNTNLTGTFRVTRGALPLMRHGGSIVIVSSMAGPRGAAERAHYGASKMGQIGFMRALAKELGPRQIRVNAVAAFVTRTDETLERPRAVLDHYAEMTALGRLAEPQEIANVVVFLTSDLAGFVSGATIDVHGGS